MANEFYENAYWNNSEWVIAWLDDGIAIGTTNTINYDLDLTPPVAISEIVNIIIGKVKGLFIDKDIRI